ncbi:MAG TPA: AAA family ATPase, partial [Nannocystis sp.]
MSLTELIAALARPEALGHPPDATVEVVHTHVSVVLLVGDDVYKFKKPQDLDFLDYSTLDRRRHFCELEVTLNRRLAPDVYLGVVEIRRDDAGELRVEGPGEVVEVAVHMRRLPDAAALACRVEQPADDPRGVDAAALRTIGARVLGFHRAARRGPEVSAWATFAVVAANARQNFAQLADLGRVSEALLTRLERCTEEALGRHHATIEARARRRIACDTHGDLRLEHIYLFPERPPPGDLVILDCIEFAEQFRCADPIADLAFLVMDLHRVGRRDLATALLAGYFAAYDAPLAALPDSTGDVADERAEARALLPLYTAYRATVRAKVEAFKAAEPEVPPAVAAAAAVAARRYLLLALYELQAPALRPCLVLVAGLPGTGKSTLARALAAEGFGWVRSDAVRKQLAGLPPEAPAHAATGAGIYTAAWTDRTYARCHDLARAALSEGERVVVDANFKTAAQRAPFVALARELGVPLQDFVCEAEPAAVEERLSRRTGDVSDAGITVYRHARAAWEPVALDLDATVVDTTGP